MHFWAMNATDEPAREWSTLDHCDDDLKMLPLLLRVNGSVGGYSMVLVVVYVLLR
jgi:hypothetical protein